MGSQTALLLRQMHYELDPNSDMHAESQVGERLRIALVDPRHGHGCDRVKELRILGSFPTGLADYASRVFKCKDSAPSTQPNPTPTPTPVQTHPRTIPPTHTCTHARTLFPEVTPRVPAWQKPGLRWRAPLEWPPAQPALYSKMFRPHVRGVAKTLGLGLRPRCRRGYGFGACGTREGSISQV